MPYRRRPEVRWLILMTTSLAVISFCSLNVYIQESLQDKTLFSRLRFVGFSVLGQSWFFFLALTYTRYRFFRKTWVAVITLLPSLFTITFSLVPDWNHWLTRDYELFKWQGAALVTFKPGEWFPLHFFTANFFALSALVLLLYTIPRSSGAKKKQMIVLLVSSSISLFIDSYSVFTNSPLRWAMLSGGTFLITVSAIMYAIQKHGLLDLAPIAKNLIFREIPDPTIILDDQDRVLDFNSTAAFAFQLTSKDLSSPWKSLNIIGGLSSEQPTSEWSLATPSGIRSYQIDVIALNSQNTVDGKIIFFRDISTQKQIEEKLNNDLEFKARLLSVIAHDFSSIIQTQSALSSHLHEEVQPELRRQTKALKSISFASQDLMTNILRWSQSTEKQLASTAHPFEIHTLINEVIDNLEGSLSIKDLKVKLQSQASPVIVEGDSVMIESVVRNLLTNAIRASLPGHSIQVLLSTEAENLKIHIQDHGVGMNAKKLAIVRGLDTVSLTDSEKRPEGFGIGLIITRKLVNIHQGQLEFESEEGQGTLVTLTLPLKKPSC